MFKHVVTQMNFNLNSKYDAPYCLHFIQLCHTIVVLVLVCTSTSIVVLVPVLVWNAPTRISPNRLFCHGHKIFVLYIQPQAHSCCCCCCCCCCCSPISSILPRQYDDLYLLVKLKTIKANIGGGSKNMSRFYHSRKRRAGWPDKAGPANWTKVAPTKASQTECVRDRPV